MKNAIEHFRRTHGMSLQKIADMCAFRSRSTVFQHCNGHREISAESAIKYAKGLGIPLHDLRPDLWPAPEAGTSPNTSTATEKRQ